MSKSKLFPHDRYIRSLMSNQKVALEFFEAHLPELLKKECDLSTLQLQKSSFIDDKLKLQEADLLYSVQIKGKTAYFYLLLEHMSSQYKLLPFRILKYMIAIQEAHLKKTQSKTLPFIYPIILYSGQKPYKYSTNLMDLFEEHKELAKATFLNPYHLIDLSQVSDQELKNYTYFGVMALIAKHIHDGDILPTLKGMVSLLKDLEFKGEIEYIYLTLSYIVEAGEVLSPEDFIQTVKQLESKHEGKLMTIAELFKQEGRKEGKLEGIQEGIQKGMQKGELKKAQKIAIEMLKEDESLTRISKYTGLSFEDIQMLKTKIH